MRAPAAVLRRDAFHAGLDLVSAGFPSPVPLLEAYEAALAAVPSAGDRVKVAQRVGLFADERKAGRIPKDALIECSFPLDLDGYSMRVTIDACWVAAENTAIVCDWSVPELDTLGLAALGLAWSTERGGLPFRWLTVNTGGPGGRVIYSSSPVMLELEAEGLWKRVRAAHIAGLEKAGFKAP